MSAEAFLAARDLLLELREQPERAYAEFRWPELDAFNWALDFFDRVAAGNDRPALRVVEADGSERSLSFAELSARSNRVANRLRSLGVGRGDRLLLMLGNQVELWETILATTKLGAVIIPATTLLGPNDLVDRIERGNARHVVVGSGDAAKFDDVPGDYTRVAVGEPVAGWTSYADADDAPAEFEPDGVTRASDPLLLYFTSGTTAKPKLVEHTHASYPAGHLSTMYWIGARPGDVHLNISSPGWAKHAWSSVFAPWNAEATVLVVNQPRFEAKGLLDEMVRCEVATFCAPPTVWRMLIQEDLAAWRPPLREAVAAGEPLNPEVIEQVRRAWGITIRDGYGQTETTAQVGNPPGAHLKEGSMGRPLPGYRVALVDPISGEEAEEGEICLPLADRPLALMTGYRDSEELNAEAMRGGYYHTGDVARRDEEGYITYVGRADDVFKASDYRISPFELESVLIEHPAVAEAAVVPAPDPLRLAVPKAYVTLAAGHEPGPETALSILRHAREQLAPYKRVRRLEFAELPKTISGKIRRVELRTQEEARSERAPAEFREEDFPELKAR
ncbi:MAG TPA: AMP-binding protein [Gaiellaceae bacterium]|jgi:acetyl-CoA synthetase|nr:AMP-binding protein [Gaiellaceae bacterium]